MIDPGLTPGEVDVLIDGLTDYVSFNLVLTRLGLEPREGVEWIRPSAADLGAAFGSVQQLVDGGFACIGRLEPVNGDFVTEDQHDVRRRVEAAVATATTSSEWAFVCWLANTPHGDAFARAAHGED